MRYVLPATALKRRTSKASQVGFRQAGGPVASPTASSRLLRSQAALHLFPRQATRMGTTRTRAALTLAIVLATPALLVALQEEGTDARGEAKATICQLNRL